MELNSILSSIDIKYIVCTILFTYLILLVGINTTKQYVKILTSIFSGIVIGFIFYKFKWAENSNLFTSFLISIVSYEWGIKQLIDLLHINPNNNQWGIKI